MLDSIINCGITYWVRNCPVCNKELYHKDKKYRNKAHKKNSKCQVCANNDNVLNSDEFYIIKNDIKYWIRNCPTCDKEIYHTHRRNRNQSKKINRKCKSCATSDGNLNRAKSGKYFSNESIQKLREASTGVRHTDETKRKISQALKRTESRLKNRLIQIKRIEECMLHGHQMTPNFNKSACKYLDNLSQEMGWNLQHAMNGGEYHIKELGYWVDGYDKERNIVVEYDEPHHLSEFAQERDINRQQEIKEYLGCKFYRYNELEKS